MTMSLFQNSRDLLTTVLIYRMVLNGDLERFLFFLNYLKLIVVLFFLILILFGQLVAQCFYFFQIDGSQFISCIS